VSDSSLMRPTDLSISRGNAQKASKKLDWQARSKMPDVVRMMIKAEMISPR
jgi:GDPmannose 4,6-dehydratase